ncbi:hypothetical protein [Nodosilinea sp. FACHB-13]|uniref:hypothetical protein n=1 Tax=Cyanophyceae TaxID=3028117 RepID=UPI0016851BE6|nr:hypothetical protein [Nodosilinea sp. FACHB-13]MBD2108117.1 hypothetical protein [Nodosilinea sp. FACHB-13]
MQHEAKALCCCALVSSQGFLYSSDRVPNLARSPIRSILLWFNPGRYSLGLPLHGTTQGCDQP